MILISCFHSSFLSLFCEYLVPLWFPKLLPLTVLPGIGEDIQWGKMLLHHFVVFCGNLTRFILCTVAGYRCYKSILCHFFDFSYKVLGFCLNFLGVICHSAVKILVFFCKLSYSTCSKES